MNPAFRESSALKHVYCSDAVKIHDRIHSVLPHYTVSHGTVYKILAAQYIQGIDMPLLPYLTTLHVISANWGSLVPSLYLTSPSICIHTHSPVLVRKRKTRLMPCPVRNTAYVRRWEEVGEEMGGNGRGVIVRSVHC